MTSNTHFDAKAKTWDDDADKIARGIAVADGIRHAVTLKPNMRGFEFGCGTGLLSFALRDDLVQITLADNSQGMLDVLQQKIAAEQVSHMQSLFFDLENDALPNEQFDLLYSLMTFHHLADIPTALKKLHTLTAANGHLCVCDLDAEDGSFHGHEFKGHKGFHRDELAAQVMQAGFRSVNFFTVFEIDKQVNGVQKKFPLFLMVAEKAPA